MDFAGIIEGISVWILPILLAITLHEAAHGYAAWKLGDDTAYRLGRVNFNPLRHIDPFGTIVLPALLLLTRAPFLFGWAKPVPVNFHRLNSPRRDMVIVAAAGPGANILLATISALLVHVAVLLPAGVSGWALQNFFNSIFINVLLAVFNMIPLPPLDGGRVAVGLLPRPLALPLARLERYGLLILVALMLLPMLGSRFGLEFSVFEWLVLRPVSVILPFFYMLAGV